MVGAFLMWVRSGFGTNRASLVRLSYKLQLGWGNLLWESARVIFRSANRGRGTGSRPAGTDPDPGPPCLDHRQRPPVPALLPGPRDDPEIRDQEGTVDGSGSRHRRELAPQPLRGPPGKGSRCRDQGAAPPGSGLTENDGLLIFPEGTRFTAGEAGAGPRQPGQTEPALSPPRGRAPPSHAAPSRRGAGIAGGLLGRRGPRGSPRIRRVCPHQGHLGRGHGRKAREGENDEGPVRRDPRRRGHRTEWLFKVWQEMDDWIPAWTRRRRASWRRLTGLPPSASDFALPPA